MNTFSNNSSGTQLVARYTIEQRVKDAEQRRLARTARAQDRPQEPLASAPKTTHAPWRAILHLHPIHPAH